MKNLFLFCFIALLTACNSGAVESDDIDGSDSNVLASSPESMDTLGHIDISDDDVDTYKGILPCGDCGGVETELILMHERGSGEGTYIIKETLIDTIHGNRSTEERGSWTTLRGSAKDEDDVVIQIGEGDRSKYYLLTPTHNLQLLDAQLKALQVKGNHVLVNSKGL